MDVYPLGQPIRLTTTVLDIDEAPADPTALTLTVVLAGDTAMVLHWPTPAEIVRGSLGVFHYDLTPAAAGHYATYWTATGTAAGVSPDSTVLDVFDPATAPRLVSLADAKMFLRLSGTADDALLDRLIGWASARICIQVVAYASSYTQRVTSRGGRIVLSRTPVREVTAVTAVNSGAAVVAAASVVVVNPAHGVVAGDLGAYLCGVYDVTYTAGPDEVQPGVDGACLQLIQHWWSQSQSHGSSTYGDSGFVPDFDDLPHSVTNKLAVAAPPVLMA